MTAPTTPNAAWHTPGDLLSVAVYNDKYTVVMRHDGSLHALRYGEPWRNCTGDGLILALAQEVDRLRSRASGAGK